ncbi:Cotton fiber expressed protein [Quillaja saponaria]|uniref:Cotton fiber expressed protein n=1 Tax=Quillaja saponaria TaxID=32244 RepID=A0AAD7KXU7_QUISA|nr:Cotton fiber expressed protein [Quillaja saponaria]
MALVLSLKVLLISVAVLFTALGLKLSVPLVMEFSFSHVPVMWNTFLSWLKPPYLYFIINGIIISIAASSRFHRSRGHQTTEPVHQSNVSANFAYEIKNFPEVRSEFFISESPVESEPVEKVVTISEVKTVVVNSSDQVLEDENKNEIDGMVSTWITLKRLDSAEIPPDYLSPAEKPLVSARFGHRKPLKASPEGGRLLSVSKTKRHETMENTWKAITEGRAMPLSRHMKKCDTWQNHGREINLGQLEPSFMKKSNTFKDRNNPSSSTVTSKPKPTKLRKEPSLSQDELNRRVEAFIKKFNEEMRLQRQESLNQYKEMISSGNH